MLLAQSTFNNTHSLWLMLLWTKWESNVAATPPHHVKQGVVPHHQCQWWGKSYSPHRHSLLVNLHLEEASSGCEDSHGWPYAVNKCSTTLEMCTCMSGKHRKSLRNKEDWRVVQLWASHLLHTKTERWARKILTWENFGFTEQRTQHEKKEECRFQQICPCGLGKTVVKVQVQSWIQERPMLAGWPGWTGQELWLVVESFRRFGCQDTSLLKWHCQKTLFWSSMGKLGWNSNDNGFLFGNRNQLITTHYFSLKLYLGAKPARTEGKVIWWGSFLS